MRDLHVEEIHCKTILNRSTMPFAEYTLNAYLGCAFGCSYCYVPVMRQRRGQCDEMKWGSWVQVKVNAPDVLRRQMLDIPMEARISIGTATDSWQPLEKKYGIARRILEELAYYPNHVGIVTRSPLLIRDIDVLKRMEDVSVGVSLPTFDDRIRRIFEPDAPAIAGRINLIKRLVDAGIKVPLFWCPILNGVMDKRDAVRDYLEREAQLNVSRLIWQSLNYLEGIMPQHLQLIGKNRAVLPFEQSDKLSKDELASEIAYWCKRYGLATV